MTAARRVTLLLFLHPITLLAEPPWQFESAVVVSGARNGGHHFYHHLDSSGRRNIAVSEQYIAIAWEDDRDATPRIYLGYKETTDSKFSQALQISGEGEAYEPSIVPLSEDRFVIAWEENGTIHARLALLHDRLQLGAIVKLDNEASSQVSLSAHGERIIAVWSQRSGRFGRIYTKQLHVTADGKLKIKHGCAVDSLPPSDDQLYPTAAFSGDRLVVAWEDRRPKHTIIMAAAEQPANSCRFSNPVRISEKPEGRNLPYGAGHGVSRVAMGSYGEQGLFAVWADKRDFRDGYDIWGAPLIADEKLFGDNQKVQDDFGGLSKQRHATIAGARDGTLIVAWDDEREGDTDLVMSWLEDGNWSDDWPVSVASGEGQQGNPSIALDSLGNLHMSWVQRESVGGPTQLKYAFGKMAVKTGYPLD
ncbi:MAG: hypothetical protein ABW098_02750 [Candidatus Thiodiazotropha sp.]